MHKLFIAIGMLIVAWRFAPTEGATQADWWIFSGVMGFIGAIGVVKFLITSPGRPVHWFARAPAKLVMVLAIWGVIAWAAQTYGTPHLNWWSVVDSNTGIRHCVYVGWKGTALTETPCPTWRWL